MKAVTCAFCGSKMVKNGRTSSGRQRWRCLACGSSQALRYDSTATRLEEFLGWLLSKETQLDMPGQGRSFRRRTAGFWRVWPMPTWVWAHLYDTGALEITASSTPDTLRTVLATGRICANAHYQAVSATPWYDQRASLRTCEFKADLGSVALASLDYWFYSNTTLTAVTGWANVRGLASLRYAFNACSGLVTLDLSGLDPSSLADLFYAFAQCGSLTTIYADASWALPAGVSGMGTFYNDTQLVGGNGTAYSSSAYGYARMVIDRAGQAGYLTAT